MKTDDVATVRTTVNASILAALLAVIAKITHWNMNADDLLPYMPLIIPIIAAFYRISLILSKRFAWLGSVLYGVNVTPIYPNKEISK